MAFCCKSSSRSTCPSKTQPHLSFSCSPEANSIQIIQKNYIQSFTLLRIYGLPRAMSSVYWFFGFSSAQNKVIRQTAETGNIDFKQLSSRKRAHDVECDRDKARTQSLSSFDNNNDFRSVFSSVHSAKTIPGHISERTTNVTIMQKEHLSDRDTLKRRPRS